MSPRPLTPWNDLPTGDRETRVRRQALVTTLALILLHPAWVEAQATADSVEAPPSRLALIGGAGSGFGGPGSSLSRRLRGMGYTDTKPAWCFVLGWPPDGSGSRICFPEEAYPRTTSPGSSMGVAFRYSLAPRLDLGGGYWVTVLGGASGYKAGPPETTLLSYWDVSMGWVSALWKPHPLVRAGGGLGIYALKHTMAGEGPARIGAMGEAGIEWPAEGRWFIDLSLRLHLVPGVEVDHAFGRGTPRNLRVNPSHGALALAAGMRP